jgi:hypothetical protein
MGLRCFSAGVWISFSKHSPNWQVVKHFHSPSQKTTGQKYRKGQWEGQKNPRQNGEWVCIFTRHRILNSASGRAVIRALVQWEAELYSISITCIIIITEAKSQTAVPRDCSDPRYRSQPSGVRLIQFSPCRYAAVYCDQDTAGGGWTVWSSF